MPNQDFDIVGGYDNERVEPIDAERSVNLFEYLNVKAKKSKNLINTSGLVNTGLVFPGTTNGFRGQFVFQGNGENAASMYVVIGRDIYRITGTTLLTATKINLSFPLIGTSGYVGIDANTHQVIFVDGTNGYIWDTISQVFVQITDPAFPIKPIDVCVLDEFFIVPMGDTNAFRLSSIDNGLVWGADNVGTLSTFTMAAASSDIVITFVAGFSTANYQIGTPVFFSDVTIPIELKTQPFYFVSAIINPTTIRVSATDGGPPITSVLGGNGHITNKGQLQQGAITSHSGTFVACRTLHRKLFLFSQNFTEVWENAGIGTNLPFRRNNALLMEYGCAAIGSIAVGFDIMIFLSRDKDGLGSVMLVSGTQSMAVSGRALDFQISQYAADPAIGIADCRSFFVRENGLIFYRMNFTKANHTYIYNVSMSDQNDKRWHEEEVLNGNRHPSETHGFFNGLNYVGNYKSPILYLLDPFTFTNDFEAIRRMRISRPFVPAAYQRTRIDRFQLDLLQGSILDIESEELFLLAENGLIILTEDDINILLEQGLLHPDTDQQYVYLSFSKDGGQSYGNITSAPMGRPGDRNFRTLWRKLGVIPRGQAFVVKIEFFEDGPFIILGASWSYEILPE